MNRPIINRPPQHCSDASKSGAALVIVLGFLAILTITIIAFTTQTRSERIANRNYVASARTAHLLNSALTHAMADIDSTAGTAYFPPFFSLVSKDSEHDFYLSDTVDFETEAEFIPRGNALLDSAFSDAVNAAEWKTVLNGQQNAAIGRIGYIIINSSGLLDANAVGGVDAGGNVIQRRAGTSPSEIQLSCHSFIIDEFNANQKQNYPHIDPDNPLGVPRRAASEELSVGQAFAYNREHAWKRFETIRDIKKLGQVSSPNLFTTDIKSFSTYSFDPRKDTRSFMGTNSATLNAEAVTNNIPAAADAGFVLNQLRDYLDTNALPEDENGEYTDFSVEAVPMINECTISISSLFIPTYSVDDEGEPVIDTISVSNSMNLMIEVWYPFKNYTNPDTFEIGFKGIDFDTGELQPNEDSPFWGSLLDWSDSIELDSSTARPGASPQSYLVYTTNTVEVVDAKGDLVDLFETLANNVVFSEIYCSNITQMAKVDSVKNFKLELEDLVYDALIPDIEELEEGFFDELDVSIATNYIEVGRAVFDPRLNWNASRTSQWVNVDDYGYFKYPATMGSLNKPLHKQIKTPDPIGTIYTRNEDRIDSPWEFTHLLYSKEKPWNTFQMLEEYDPDNTREILKNLSPYNGEPPRHGRINPYSPHTNVIAAAFMNLPVNEYEQPENIRRLNAADATKSALLFMHSMKGNNWPDNPMDYSGKISLDYLKQILGERPPLELEGFFRNSYELFNPRDSLYTIFLTAQSGIDADKNGSIEDLEVQGTRQAVVYVWRDPLTGKAAPVFFGLTDTLQRNDSGGQPLSDLLQAFEP